MDKSADTSTIQQIRDKLMQTLKDREELVKENAELVKRNADLRQVRARSMIAIKNADDIWRTENSG